MEYYDMIISLGERCSTAMALRDLNLTAETMPFDWTGNYDETKSGQGGFSKKVELICENFKDFINLEDLENCGPCLHDEAHFVVVNHNNGLRWAHDFPADRTLENGYSEVKKKYDRRIARFYDGIRGSKKILFVFFAFSTGYENVYLLQQHSKLQIKFPDTEIDLLCLMQDPHCDAKAYEEIVLSKGVKRINCNMVHSQAEDEIEKLRGNKELYCGILKQYCSPALLFAWQRAILQLRREFEIVHFPSINQRFAHVVGEIENLKQKLGKIVASLEKSNMICDDIAFRHPNPSTLLNRKFIPPNDNA